MISLASDPTKRWRTLSIFFLAKNRTWNSKRTGKVFVDLRCQILIIFFLYGSRCPHRAYWGGVTSCTWFCSCSWNTSSFPFSYPPLLSLPSPLPLHLSLRLPFLPIFILLSSMKGWIISEFPGDCYTFVHNKEADNYFWSLQYFLM
jgi:hypothetical protein